MSLDLHFRQGHFLQALTDIVHERHLIVVKVHFPTEPFASHRSLVHQFFGRRQIRPLGFRMKGNRVLGLERLRQFSSSA